METGGSPDVVGPFDSVCRIPCPGSGETADMDDATWARLQDNTLEYDEIENLVLYYNLLTWQVVDTIEVQLDR